MNKSIKSKPLVWKLKSISKVEPDRERRICIFEDLILLRCSLQIDLRVHYFLINFFAGFLFSFSFALLLKLTKGL